MKMQARFTLETMDQVAATIEFARSMSIHMEMGALQEKAAEQMIVMGDTPPTKEQRRVHEHLSILLDKGPATKLEVVRYIAKKLRKNPKGMGIAVRSLLRQGVLKVQ